MRSISGGPSPGVAAAVLEAIEDTFAYTRVGQLRLAEAAELLLELEKVEFARSPVRDYALSDLLQHTGLGALPGN